VTVFLLLLLPVSQAAAHALVVTSTPAANAAVAGPQLDLRVQFSDRIDKQRSKLSLAGAAGQSFPIQSLEVESADTLAGHVADLPAGSYRLLWQVLAIDGHITRGEIPFTVTAP
jgi:hypothetical protein